MNIRQSLSDVSEMNKIMTYLRNSKQCDKLIYLIEEMKQIIPYSPGTTPYVMWKEQCMINLPLLYLASIYLFSYAKSKSCNTFLFASRDCCHWYKIFKKLFPNTNTHYFHCSRNMFGRGFRTTHTDYKNYIVSLVNGDTNNLEKSIYVDIHGSGQHMYNYFKKNFDTLPYCFLLSTGCPKYRKFPHPAKSFIPKKLDKLIALIFDVTGGPIEMLNYDLIGTMQDYSSKTGAIREPLEYPCELIKHYHEAMKCIIRKIHHIDNTDEYDLENLEDLIKNIFMINQNTTSIIRQIVNHVGRHARTY